MNRLRLARSVLTLFRLALILGAVPAPEGRPAPAPTVMPDSAVIDQWNPQFDLWGNYRSADASEPPQLVIAPGEGGLNVSWPLLFTGWVLEQSPDLAPPIVWVRVPPGLYQSDLTNISVALPSLTGNMFFRLRRMPAAIPGLTGHWTFDEGQSQAAQDSSGNDHTLWLSNVVWAAGRIGSGALWFNGGSAGADGSRAWVSNADFSVLPPTGQPFSVSFWFNADALIAGWSGLMGNDANGSNGWHVALHTSGPGTNELVFAATGNGASLNVAASTLLLPTQWHELTATYDGNEGAIYLDGEPLARGQGTLAANSEPIWFGGGVGSYDSFAGRMDELRTSTNALSAEAVSLAGEWHFDENTGAVATDSSIGGHPAAVSNSAAWVAGKSGSGINLSNSTVLIRNDYSDVLPPTGGPFSLSFWLQPGLLPSGSCGLMSCADGTNTGWSLGLHSGGPGQSWLDFSSTNSGGTLALSAPVDLAEGVWSKLDLTYNGGIATFYVNGRKVLSDSGGIQGSTAPLLVGAVPGMNNFDGVIDELKIYRRERGEAEIGPVAKVMWETALVNTATNLVLQGFGPAGKPLSYAMVDTLSPSNGVVLSTGGSSIVTYTAGAKKGPDAFTYTVSDGEFTSPPTVVAVSVVQPHWLAPAGGTAPVLDGSSPDGAWVAGSAEALDAIWRTNAYYDCFFYAAGQYQTTGCRYWDRRTANPGCKHIGSGSDGLSQTRLKLVNIWEAGTEEVIFGGWTVGAYCDGFEVRDMVLDCNAENTPKYTQGEPVWITIPLATTGRVDSITLHWDDSTFLGLWRFGPAQTFSVCTRMPGANGYVTNCATLSSTGVVDIVPIDAETDEIVLRLERRAAGIDFYSLAEIEVTGATVSLPSATAPDGSESDLDPTSGAYGILQAMDWDNRTAWASGPEDQVRIELPLQSAVTISRVDLSWNCQTIDGLGRLGSAADYQIQARDPNTYQYYDVPFVRQPRTPQGLEISIFGTPGIPNPIFTDQLVILLKSKELGVDFYSLSELNLWDGWDFVPLKLPNASNSLSWGNYQILRAFDRDASTQWASDTQGMVGAVEVVGNNLKFSHLRVVGFGTKATRECFPLGINTPPPQAPAVRMGNALIENCVFTDPATNNTDGLTTIFLVGIPPHTLTNTLVRGCTVAGVKSHFRYSHAFTAVDVENCVATDCQVGVYFEPNPVWGDSVGPVLVRSNQFLNVDSGVFLAFAAGAKFDSLTCLGNDIVLNGAGGWGFFSYDTWVPGPSGTITNATAINNIVRYPDWSPRPAGPDGGLNCSDIHNAVFGHNVIALGTTSALRLRACPSGSLPPPVPTSNCDDTGPGGPPGPDPTLPPCLDVLPPGYRRTWFDNRDLLGAPLKVRYWTTNSDGFASQQQWP